MYGLSIKMRNLVCDKDKMDIDIKQKELQKFVDEMDSKLANLTIKYS